GATLSNISAEDGATHSNTNAEDGGDNRTLGTGRCAGDWNFLVREKYSCCKVGLISNKEKYSRLERRRTALGKHIEGQSRVTAYFPILNEIEMILLTNKEVISSLEARCKELSIDSKSTSRNFELSNLLKLLMETAQKNSTRKNHGQQYDEDIKLFAAYLYIIGGRMITVNLILKKSSQPIIEGLFRFQELKDFLLAHDYPLRVAVSEDGTRIQEKICYDRPTNQIIGPC
ncbi:Siroheme synthase, partial [Frankliniella fusca]